MKKLRSIAGGDTYTIIYLKMQLLSLENGGLLFHEGVEDDMLEEIALDIDESIDNVRITFQFLEKCNLIESKVDQMFLPEVVENIGSETSSAQRVRRFREVRAKKALHCNGDVTKSNNLVTSSNVELEKEIELKIKKETKKEKYNPQRDLLFFDDSDFKEVWKDYISVRTKKKAVNSDRAIRSVVCKLKVYSNNNKNNAIEVLENSINGGWSDIYEPKNKTVEKKEEPYDKEKAKKEFFERYRNDS